MGTDNSTDTRKPKTGRGMAIAALILSIISLLLSIAAVFPDTATEADADEQTTTDATALGDGADIDGWHVSLLDDIVTGTDDAGEPAFAVTLRVTNNTGEDAYADVGTGGTIRVNALQNNEQLDGDVIASNEDSDLYDAYATRQNALATPVTAGDTVDVPVLFHLEDTDSDMTLQVIDETGDAVIESSYMFADADEE